MAGLSATADQVIAGARVVHAEPDQNSQTPAVRLKPRLPRRGALGRVSADQAPT